MKTIKILTLCTLGVAAAAFTACSDQSEEITSYELSRNLSPINLEASNVQETSAIIKWTPSAKATSYNLLVFAEDSMSYNLTATPAKAIEGITEDQIPVLIDGLFFDTQYTVYVQAITADNESRTSTWNGAYFRTNTKQFLKAPKPSDIADRSVTLRWEAEEGFSVSTIVVGDITHEVTPEEAEAGEATINGLTPETDYTAYLYYNGKQCGNRNFTTIADLEGAILVHEGDNVKQLIEEAEDGATIAFYGGTYFLNPNQTVDEESGEVVSVKGGSVKVTKSIIIKGIYPTDRPILKGRFEMYEGAGLSLSQVIIEGAENASGDQTVNYKDAVDYKALEMNNVEIRNFVKGICYGNVTGTIESISFNECVIHDIVCDGGDFFDLRKSYVKKVSFKNSTIYNCAHKRDFIRYDDASADYTDAAPEIIVDHCTINNVLNESNEKRLLYVRFAGNSITWTNNIVANTKAVYTNQSKTNTPTYSNNYYFNCQSKNIFAPSVTEGDTKVYWNGDVNGSEGDDPNFTLTDEGYYTIGNESVKKLEVGDPRGYK